MADFQERANKYRKKTNTPLQDESKVYGIDETLLNELCCYVISSNQSIHKFGVSSLKRLFDSISPESFKSNPIVFLKYQFLMAGLEIRAKGIRDQNIILSGINRKVDIEGLKEAPGFLKELSDTEVEYIEGTITSILNNACILSNVHTLMNLCQSYETANFRDRNNFVDMIRKNIENLNYQFRKNDMERDSSSTVFRLSGLEDSIEDIHRYITEPSFKLKTGMQGFNDLLGGGFEKGRVYSFFGLAGEGKTVTLENMMYQIWKYNNGFKTKDPTKKPCIVYLTMENFVIEYICALYHIMTRGKELKNCANADEAIAEFKKCKFEYGIDNNIEIVIKFKPVKSVSTDYLFRMTEELEEEGFETICVIQDYLMRLKPTVITKDTYEDLGTIVNDLKTFATIKQVPVITASQLNREAAKIVDESRCNNQVNIINRISRSNIGDSVNIDRNLDASIIIIPEIGQDNKKYMAFKLTKHRYPIDPRTRTLVYQPFYETSAIALEEDVGLPEPASKVTLGLDNDEIRKSFKNTFVVNPTESIKSLLERHNKTKENAEKNAEEMLKPGLSKTEKALSQEEIDRKAKEDIERRVNSILESQKINENKIEVVRLIKKKDRARLRGKLQPRIWGIEEQNKSIANIKLMKAREEAEIQSIIPPPPKPRKKIKVVGFVKKKDIPKLRDKYLKNL